MIYIPPTEKDWGQAAWLTTGDCVWDGHPALRKTSRLATHYPKLGDFFQVLLRVKAADMANLVKEAALISLDDDLTYIASLLGAISHGLRDNRSTHESATEIAELASKKVFPVKHSCPWGGFDELRSCLSDDLWFIADRPHLRQSFQGQAHLLAFSLEHTHNMSDLLDFLGLGERFLSVVATGSVGVSGRIRKHRAYSNALRSKAHVIAR